MGELSRTRAEAYALLEQIDSLRVVESAFRNAFVGDFNDASAGNFNAAGVSAYLAKDFAGKADRYRDEAAGLVYKHAFKMSPLSASAGRERSDATMCCECGELFFIDELRGSFMDRHCPLCGCRLREGAYDSSLPPNKLESTYCCRRIHALFVVVGHDAGAVGVAEEAIEDLRHPGPSLVVISQVAASLEFAVAKQQLAYASNSSPELKPKCLAVDKHPRNE